MLIFLHFKNTNSIFLKYKKICMCSYGLNFLMIDTHSSPGKNYFSTDTFNERRDLVQK